MKETEKAVEIMLKHWNKRIVRWLKKDITFPKMRMTGYQVPRVGSNLTFKERSLKVGSTQSSDTDGSGGHSRRPSMTGFQGLDLSALRSISQDGTLQGQSGTFSSSSTTSTTSTTSSTSFTKANVKSLSASSSFTFLDHLGRPRSASELAVMDTTNQSNAYDGSLRPNMSSSASANEYRPLPLVRTASLRMRVEIMNFS